MCGQVSFEFYPKITHSLTNISLFYPKTKRIGFSYCSSNPYVRKLKWNVFFNVKTFSKRFFICTSIIERCYRERLRKASVVYITFCFSKVINGFIDYFINYDHSCSPAL